MKRQLISGIFAVIAILILAYGVWLWKFCRFQVGPDQMAIITAKEGANLPSGQILADPGQKGIWREPLPEGRYFLNPITHEWKIVPLVFVPAGKVGIVTAKDGSTLPPGEFLANEGQRGIWKDVLGPGKYRLNPEGYDVTLADAINVPIGYVGVVTSLAGNPAPRGEFAGPGQKGVRKDILQPGLYYVNPNAYKVDVLEIGLSQVSLTGREGGQVLTKNKVEVQNQAMEQLALNVLAKQAERRQNYLDQQVQERAKSDKVAPAKTMKSQVAEAATKKLKTPVTSPAAAKKQQTPESLSSFDLSQYVEFPSRDGFEIQLDMTLEFELEPRHIAEIMLNYGDLPAVVDKIIMPQIQSISRLKGSSYRAQDFILGEGREKFQNELKETLTNILGSKDIKVHNSLIRHVDVPEDILRPIQQASLAVEQNLTNIELQNTARKQAQLNTEESLIEQRRQQVMQETEKMVAEIKAQQEKSVAEINAETSLKVAAIIKDTAGVRADSARITGMADAKVISMVEGEKSRGFQMKVAASGNAEAYNLLTFSEKLSHDLDIRLIHAGDGTLWTDLNQAGLTTVGGIKAASGTK